MVVVDTRVFSPEHIMVGERKTSDYAYMISIIWNIERVPPYCYFAADIGELLERDLISLLTRRKSRIVPDDISFSGRCGWCSDIRWAKKDTINVEGWPYTSIPKSPNHLILIVPFHIQLSV